jgi:outer membrane protein assembly factor BamB
LDKSDEYTKDVLVAINAAHGKELWRKPKLLSHGVAPKVWSKDGTDYVISHNSTGVVTCVEARTGRELWQFAGVVPTKVALMVHGDYLLAPVPSANPAQAGHGEREMERLGCWQLSTKEAKPLWVSTVESVFSDEYMSQIPVGLWRNRVYYRHDNEFWCLDLPTGRLLGQGPAGPAIYYRHSWTFDAGRVAFWEGRMVCVSNYSHDSGNPGADMYQSRKLIVLDPAPDKIRFREAVMLPNQRFSAYDEASPTMAYVDGRLYVRGDDGVYCYDLREPEKTKP